LIRTQNLCSKDKKADDKTITKAEESQKDMDLLKEKLKREAEVLVLSKLNALLKEEKFRLNSG